MTSNPTILITGASGLLGRVLLKTWKHRFRVVAASHSSTVHHSLSWVGDLTAVGAAEALIETARPDLVVHAAAFTNVDGCERDPKKAIRVNAEATGQLARAARRSGASFVYISTESVFDGSRGNYRESDKPHPLNEYAASKLLGEQEAQSAHDKTVVLRVGLEGWRSNGSPGFIQWVVEGLRRQERLTICTDLIHTVSFPRNLADIIEKLWALNASGLYHVGASKPASNWEIAQAAAHLFGLNSSPLRPITSDALPWLAKRPKDVSLVAERLRGTLGDVMWDLVEGVTEMKREEASGDLDIQAKPCLLGE